MRFIPAVVLSGLFVVACTPANSGDEGTGGGTGGGVASGRASGGSSGSSSSGGSPGSSGGTGGGGSAGTGGTPAPTTGTGGSSSTGTGGSPAATGGTTGNSDAGTPASDTGPSTPTPTPSGKFPLCPKCVSIFDGKTLDGWTQDPAGSFEIKAGAIASTGKGAHAWTKDDYEDYRIFFDIRQIKGNHKPCTTVFTTRPANGKAARGLNGIQFQPPTGGSWDYRPGKNSGPNATNWMYPNPRPTFDIAKWNRCEMLVKGSTGEFKAACCEIEGKDTCKGMLVLSYKDMSAAKKGPFALMMHNAGLFDEFKEFWVEVNPTEPELLIMK